MLPHGQVGSQGPADVGRRPRKELMESALQRSQHVLGEELEGHRRGGALPEGDIPEKSLKGEEDGDAREALQRSRLVPGGSRHRLRRRLDQRREKRGGPGQQEAAHRSIPLLAERQDMALAAEGHAGRRTRPSSRRMLPPPVLEGAEDRQRLAPHPLDADEGGGGALRIRGEDRRRQTPPQAQGVKVRRQVVHGRARKGDGGARHNLQPKVPTGVWRGARRAPGNQAVGSQSHLPRGWVGHHEDVAIPVEMNLPGGQHR